MTQEEWLVATAPDSMLEFLRGKASDRKLRLFAVACGRRVAEWMTDARSRHALEVGERYADGLIGRRPLAAARRAAYAATHFQEAAPSVTRLHYPVASHAANVALDAVAAPGKYEASEQARITAGTASSLLWHLRRGNADCEEKAVQASLLRDIFGNAFRPITLNPSWLTPTVESLARQMYESRDFSPMPILGDALEDGGCSDEAVLRHCRGDGPHVRGCWVVDVILGKS